MQCICGIGGYGMIDPNKHGIYNKEGYDMSNRRITQITWIGMLVVSIVIWYSIIMNGIFTTLLPIVGITIIAGLIIKLKEYISSMNDIFRGE